MGNVEVPSIVGDPPLWPSGGIRICVNRRRPSGDELVGGGAHAREIRNWVSHVAWGHWQPRYDGHHLVELQQAGDDVWHLGSRPYVEATRRRLSPTEVDGTEQHAEVLARRWFLRRRFGSPPNPVEA